MQVRANKRGFCDRGRVVAPLIVRREDMNYWLYHERASDAGDQARGTELTVVNWVSKAAPERDAPRALLSPAGREINPRGNRPCPAREIVPSRCTNWSVDHILVANRFHFSMIETRLRAKRQDDDADRTLSLFQVAFNSQELHRVSWIYRALYREASF